MSTEAELTEKAEVYLQNESQTSTRLAFERGELDTLRPQKISRKTFGEPVDLIVTSGRLGDKMLIGYDRESLPILMQSDPLSMLYMKEAHGVDHGGVDRSLQRSRNNVWIVRGRQLAKKVVSNCFTCKRINKLRREQIMAPLHSNRLPPSPIFDSTAIDLFGPIKIKDTVRRRVTKDVWGVMFVCTVTSAIHLEVTEDYSTDAFLLCLRSFMNLRGTPSRIVSDPGSQLVAARKQTEDWDYSRIKEWTTQRRIEWNVVPTNSQHFNGCAEAMIKMAKKQLVNMTHCKVPTKGELDTLFSDVIQIVNSRPLVHRAGTDTASGGPITPNHLILGRATIDVP